MSDHIDVNNLPKVTLFPSVKQQKPNVIDLAYARATRAIVRFLGTENRAAVDTLYAPAPKGLLSEADIKALERYGWAELRLMRGRIRQWQVTLTKVGREERDRRRP
jgi:hypothetical protein